MQHYRDGGDAMQVFIRGTKYNAEKISAQSTDGAYRHQNNAAYWINFQNIMFWGIPNSSNVNCLIGVDVEISGIFDNSPRNSGTFLFGFIRKLRNKFTDLNNIHTICVLEKAVVFKCGKIMMISLQIMRFAGST